MKHVFIIHSHSVFLTALGVIELKQIPVQDVLFIYARNYENSIISIPYLTIDLTAEHQKGAYTSVFHLFTYKKMIKRVDKVINSVVNDAYVLYAPHAGSHFFQIVLTNLHCIQFNYIQEGALAFDELLSSKISCRSILYSIVNGLLYFLYKNRVWANYRWILKRNIIKKMNSPKCYAISSEIFRRLPYPTELVKWPKLTPQIEIDSSCPCFVFEASVEMGIIEREIYFNAIVELVKEMAEDLNYIKFHPGQSFENKGMITQIFLDQKKNIKVLSDKIPFEMYLSSYRHMKVYGFYSSLLVYARQMGHKTFSLESRLKAESKRYASWRNRMSEL